MKYIFYLYLLLNIIKNHIIFCIDPDFNRNVSQLISSKGYPVEEYNIVTKDGYILIMQHIPSKLSKDSNSMKKLPIFLQHGLMASSSDWVVNFPSQSLGFILSDLGYDIWLGNVRGNTYGKRHTKLSPNSPEFWNFSFDEMALYDLPAMIDHVLMVSKAKSLIYIGHSQGTTIAFSLLSEKPEYNDKIELFIALAPVATVGYISNPVKYLVPFSNDIGFLLRQLGYNEFMPKSSFLNFFAEYMCAHLIEKWCKNLFFTFTGMEHSQLNVTRIPVYLSHNPAGTSTLDIIHWAQMVKSKKFQKFDFGPEKNLIKYGQTLPPEYHPEKITTPIAIFWALNDIVADPVDVNLLKKKLKKLLLSHQVEDPEWGHVDFVLGLRANEYVYQPLIEFLNKFELKYLKQII